MNIKKILLHSKKIKIRTNVTISIGMKQKDDKLDSEMKRRSKIVEKLLQLEFPAKKKSEKWHTLKKNGITKISDGGCKVGEIVIMKHHIKYCIKNKSTIQIKYKLLQWK